jgi:predicted phosphodiesterase
MAKKKTLAEKAHDFEVDRKIRRLERANKELLGDIETSMKVIERMEVERDTLLGLSDRSNAKPWKRCGIKHGRAASVLVLSDLHIGEVVRADTVLGLNEFNHEVAERRIKQAFNRSLLLFDKQRSVAAINELVVFLGGDLIGGKIHSDQAEVNDLGIASSVELAEEVLERGLRTLQAEAGMKTITVICLSGNHDRQTHKVQHSSFYENSNASLVYQHLRKRFKGETGIRFEIGQGEYHDLPIYGFNFRFTHGHRIKFSGGVGGLTIPWNKHVAKLNKAKKADFTIGGHLHTWTYSSEGEFLVNGSIIGTTAYSLPFGHQPPCQALLTVDKERCVTAAEKVWCE